MQKIYFTPSAAEACITELSKTVRRLQKLHKAIRFLNSLEVTHKDELDDFYASVSVNEQFHKLSHQFYSEIKEMIKQGWLLKDLEKGLVDFYALHGNKEILLCWKFGEKQIRYWHGINAGYRERKPISFLGSPFQEKN
ncbi:MAG: DUF2203 domain-containing protein [Nanoarchaeota archaeon]